MLPVILIDTNVVIDLLAKRAPFYPSAANVFDAVEKGRAVGYVNTLTLVTVYYLLRAYYKVPHREIIDRFTLLTSFIGVADVTADHVQQAQLSSFADFEDAVIFFSSKSISGITALITRNVSDFTAADIPVMTPDEWLIKYRF